MSRDIFYQPRVLRAPSNLALNTAREGAATASLGNPGRCLTTLIALHLFHTQGFIMMPQLECSH